MTTQVALVTGSSRGIGRGIAIALAKRGFSIAVHGRSISPALNDTIETIASMGVKVCAVAGDVGDRQVHEKILAEAEDQLGPLTTLVSNAGVSPLRRVDIMETEEDSYDYCMDLNAKAPFFLMQAFSNKILARERDPNLHYSIVSISSVSAVAVSVQRPEYCMSKAAAAMMAKVFAARLAPEDIQVFDIQPGIIATDMTSGVLSKYQQRIEEEDLTLIKRVGEAQDVAKICAAAAGGDLPYLVGAVLRPDGGITFERL